MSLKIISKKTPKNIIQLLQLKKRNCPVCNSNKKIKILDIYNWKKIDSDGRVFIIDKKYCLCKNCDLVYTNPTVDPKIFDKLYTNSVVGSFFDHKNSKNVLKLEKFDKLVGKYIKKDTKVLEIGCGSGVLLKHLNKKYKIKKKNLLALDPSKEVFKKFKLNKNFKIVNKFLDNFLTKEKFDLIVMDNVFEHFEYPKKSLEKINQHLSKNGIIYIAIPDTENIKTIQNDPFNHTCNYNYNNMSILLNNSKFKILNKKRSFQQINLVAKRSLGTFKRFEPKEKYKKKLISKINLIKLSLEKINKKLKQIRRNIIRQNKKIVFFGAGNYSLWILDLLNINNYIKYGVDNNLIYQNTIRNNFKIFEPKKLIDDDYDYILVSSGSYKKDIKSQILKMKINRNKILSF